MKKNLKRIVWIAGGTLLAAFAAFLYIVPPLTLLPQEAFTGPMHAAGPALEGISDPALKLIAERGKYLVQTHGCSDCHTPQGEKGPKYDQYLAGGIMLASRAEGTIISANLTSDKETGLGNADLETMKRALRSGVHHTDRPINHRAMPWPGFSQWSEEDLHAVAVYLHYLAAVRKNIPVPTKGVKVAVPFNAEAFMPGDFGE